MFSLDRQKPTKQSKYPYLLNASDMGTKLEITFQVRIRGGSGARPPLDPRFWGLSKLHLAYYFFNMLHNSSDWKIFQPRFTWHVISHLEILVSHILGY